ncbi:MAG: ABC transporter substrate-binding protein [Acidimicrobiia bacterium]|nr:ABC transporter substrate-binding protein [Acidimicrobiia bacterium]
MLQVMRASRPALWLALALSMAAWSCAPAPGVVPSTTTAPETTTTTIAGDSGQAPGPSGVVVGIGDHGAPRTLNPFLDGPDTAILDLMAPAVFATGYDIDPETRQPVPDVLEQIPTLANGGLSVNPNGTMNVRVSVDPAAVWADGTRISAADLAFTIETVMDPTLPIRSDLRARYEKIVAGSVRTSGLELTFSMDVDPAVELLFDLILPVHQVKGSDFVNDWNETMWTAGGPFEFSSYQMGQYLALDRNDRYWKMDAASGERLPFLDRLVFRFFDADGTPDPRILLAFQARDLDVVLSALPDAVAGDYLDLAREGAAVIAAPGMAWEQVNFQFGPGNRNDESLNRYQPFRAAVAHAIDRTTLADRRGTFALSSVLRTYLPDLGGDPWAAYDYDPGEVPGLLYSLGESIGEDLFLGAGPRLVITTSSDSTATVTMAGDIVVMLNEAGIGAELQLEDSALFFGQTLDNGTWDVAAWRFEGSPGRTGAVAFIEMFDPEGLPFVGNNYFRWGTVDSVVTDLSTERYAAIVDELRETVDPAEIDRLLMEAESILASEVVLIPLLIHELSGAVVWTHRVTGISANPAQSELWDVERWHRPTG